MCVRLIVGWRISKGFPCARPPVEILIVDVMSKRERIKIVFLMAMLPFNPYTLLSRDVVCSVTLDGGGAFAVSTNCRPKSATGALCGAGSAGTRASTHSLMGSNPIAEPQALRAIFTPARECGRQPSPKRAVGMIQPSMIRCRPLCGLTGFCVATSLGFRAEALHPRLCSGARIRGLGAFRNSHY